jgi:hypothetical protein
MWPEQFDPGSARPKPLTQSVWAQEDEFVVAETISIQHYRVLNCRAALEEIRR